MHRHTSLPRRFAHVLSVSLQDWRVGVSALAVATTMAAPAFAQSTGTLVIEEIVVRGTPITIGGTMVAQVEPKSRAAITAELLSRQAPGQSVLDTINLLPAVNFTNHDAYGSGGGDLTLRGFDSQRVALLQDGVPLNDSGNYAIYPNQQLESDLISQVTVNLGTSDVDSPTAAAAGGTINYITRRASDEMGFRGEVGYGSDNMKRFYGTVETGAIGPIGTKAWFSALRTTNDHFRPHGATADPAGKIQKTQFNARIDQDFEMGWISLIGHWNENRNAFLGRLSLAQFNSSPRVIPVNTPQAAAENINPSDTGNVRMLSSWDISDNITLTVDPSYQYVMANGGGAANWAETDLQLRGNSGAPGVDLNGDGDTADTVRLYRPNNTNTNRIGVTSSLIWKFADNQSVRLAYTWDRAKHRQTGEVGFIKTDGSFEPENVFAGKSAGIGGRQVILPDGTILRRRDRASIALLNQFAVEYRGRFMEDRMLFNAGLRMPFFKRELNNFCYQRDTFNAFCTTQTGTPVAGTNDGTGRPLVTFPVSGPLNTSAAFRYGQPRSFTRKYDKLLPNVSASYDFTDDLTAFASFAQTLSAPRTDDLYDQVLIDPGPETASAFDMGVRYQSGQFMAAGAVFYNNFSNRIERVLDEAAGIAFSANVGDVKLSGIDGQIGYKPMETLSFYASASYITSEIQDDIPNTVAGAPLPTSGKSLYETPKLQGGLRIQWEPLEFLSIGVQGKFVGKRWTNLVNTEQFPGYALWDLDVRFSLDSFGLENTYIQGNIRNAFDKRFLGDITTNLVGTALAQPGYRRTYIATLHAEF
jgi:iron complex outermembrane receptor protein